MTDIVLGVVGSPRRGGNTETIVDEVLRGASDAGAVTNKVLLSELQVEPCKACNSCHSNGKCIINDDMGRIVTKMRDSGTWIIGTPVYWWGPTAQIKAWIDRWYGVPRDLFKGKRIVLVVPSGGGRTYAELTVRMLQEIIPYLDMELISTIQDPGANSRNHAKSDKSLMESAYNTGYNII